MYFYLFIIIFPCSLVQVSNMVNLRILQMADRRRRPLPPSIEGESSTRGLGNNLPSGTSHSSHGASNARGRRRGGMAAGNPISAGVAVGCDME